MTHADMLQIATLLAEVHDPDLVTATEGDSGAALLRISGTGENERRAALWIDTTYWFLLYVDAGFGQLEIDYDCTDSEVLEIATGMRNVGATYVKNGGTIRASGLFRRQQFLVAGTTPPEILFPNRREPIPGVRR